MVVQRDIKRMLAYSSMENFGLMASGVGLFLPMTTKAVLLHMMNHALIKYALFYLAGTIMETYATKNMMRIHGMIAQAPRTACFFLLATPVANSDLGTRTMSQLQGNIIYKLMPKDSNMTPAQPVKEDVKEVSEVTEIKAVKEEVSEVKEDNQVKEDAEVEKKAQYCIVLASQVKRSNAEEYVGQLKKRGISDARISVDNGTLRVVCGGYDNQQEAYSHLNKIASDIEFADAWVYKMKD